MSVYVPRVYNNSNSLGYRNYQRQTITGKMVWDYDTDGNLVEVYFTNMVNKTHRMSNGKNVVYDAQLDDTVFPRFNVIGNNKTCVFNKPSVCFFMVAEPSYSIGELNEDNSLYVLLAGKGTMNMKKHYVQSMSGMVSGTLGCGCADYGHTSPTRRIGRFGATDSVDDVAAVFGNWSARIILKESDR